jgi:hypothetical protein
MANVVITIPDALVPRVITAMRALYPQHSALGDGATFKAITGELWRTQVLAQYEAVTAADAASNKWQATYNATLAQSKADAAGIG